jgi:DNA-binding XRE family transcriptional regulator
MPGRPTFLRKELQMTPSAFTAARERLGMTRGAFASALGIAPNTVTAYERGRYPVSLTVRLAIAALLYGLPPA